MINRIDITNEAKQIIKQLSQNYGDLLFYQAGGCCEGTQPQCFEKGSFMPRMNDVCIGTVEGFDFWVDKDLFEYWKHAHFTLDVLDGFGIGGFSLETPLGKTFTIHYRIFTPEEEKNLSPLKYHE
ncbi:DUF779 domain-containing protein [Zhouia sp. PK063]|uniref:DUF779 domain-containing protein n=1 Tax=Zhouia sp. PK063 TaxID=3373602 RepID=UPI0037A0C8D3